MRVLVLSQFFTPEVVAAATRVQSFVDALQSAGHAVDVVCEVPNHPDGVCYAKPQGISLEEVEDGDLVITDIPFGRILAGERATTVGHQMNREMLRLRQRL